MAWMRSAMTRSDVGISAIFANRSLRPASRSPACFACALRSRIVSRNAAFSTALMTSEEVRLAVAFLAVLAGIDFAPASAAENVMLLWAVRHAQALRVAVDCSRRNSDNLSQN